MPEELFPGVYAYTNDYPTEVAINYQLEYLVETAILSLRKLLACDKQDLKLFSTKIQYFHYYLDHLLFCMGQINDYLVVKPKDNTTLGDIILMNQRNYEFDEKKYPLLSDKKPRNLMEHLLERNQKTISKHGAFGGFNVLFSCVNEDLKQSIDNNLELYPYTLDLINKKIIFADRRYKDNGRVDYYGLELEQVEKELVELKARIENTKDILSKRFE